MVVPPCFGWVFCVLWLISAWVGALPEVGGSMWAARILFLARVWRRCVLVHDLAIPLVSYVFAHDVASSRWFCLVSRVLRLVSEMKHSEMEQMHTS